MFGYQADYMYLGHYMYLGQYTWAMQWEKMPCWQMWTVKAHVNLSFHSQSDQYLICPEIDTTEYIKFVYWAQKVGNSH